MNRRAWATAELRWCAEWIRWARVAAKSGSDVTAAIAYAKAYDCLRMRLDIERWKP